MSGVIGVSPDMRSGVVGGYHSGACIQTSVLSYYRTSHWWTQTSTWNLIGGAGTDTAGAVGTLFQVGITPRSANSRILLSAHLFLHTQQNTVGAGFQFRKDGNVLSERMGQAGIGVDAIPNMYFNQTFLFSDESPGTGSRNYQLYCKRQVGSSTNRV